MGGLRQRWPGRLEPPAWIRRTHPPIGGRDPLYFLDERGLAELASRTAQGDKWSFWGPQDSSSSASPASAPSGSASRAASTRCLPAPSCRHGGTQPESN